MRDRDAFGDVPAPRLVHHPLRPDARSVDRLDAPPALSEPDGVTTAAARQIERKPGRYAGKRGG